VKVVSINTSELKDRRTFHAYFKETFGFPDFYGNNMDAWIDCMGYLDNQNTGMTSKVFVEKNDYVVLQLLDVDDFINRVPELYQAFTECAAFVNYRRIEAGENPLIVISFFRHKER